MEITNSVILAHFKNQVNLVEEILLGMIQHSSLSNILSDLFPTANMNEIYHANKKYLLFKRHGFPYSILFAETKDTQNTCAEDVAAFEENMKNNIHGIFISHFSGIAAREDYAVEIIQSNNIALYSHKVNYSKQKIKSLIDYMDSILRHMEIVPKTISDETTLHREYKVLLKQKQIIMSHANEYHGKIQALLKEMKMSSIEKEMENKSNANTFSCDVCCFIGANANSLSAHRRGNCSKKEETIIYERNQKRKLEITSLLMKQNSHE